MNKAIALGLGVLLALMGGEVPAHATVETSDLPAPMGAAASAAGPTAEQVVIPRVSPGPTGGATAEVRVSGLSVLKGDLRMTFTAPSGTSVVSQIVGWKAADGSRGSLNLSSSNGGRVATVSSVVNLPAAAADWIDFQVTLAADRGNSRVGLVSDGSWTADLPGATSTLTAVLSYDALPALRVMPVVSSSPVVKPGERWTVSVDLANETDLDSPDYAGGVITAPSGAVFESAEVLFTVGENTYPAPGFLSANKKSLSVARPEGIPAKATLRIAAFLRSEPRNMRSGLVDDGSFRVASDGLVGPTVAVSYTAKAPAVVVSQPVRPRLAPGGIGDAVVRYQNNAVVPTAPGTKLELRAPSGTVFQTADLRVSVAGAPTGDAAVGELSADARILTVDLSDHAVPAEESADLTVSLASATDNERRGLVDDGAVRLLDEAGGPLDLTAAWGYEGAGHAVTLTQVETPRLVPGGSGDLTVRLANDDAEESGIGATFEVRAPEGAAFTGAPVRVVRDDETISLVAGVVSADKRTMTIALPEQQLRGSGWVTLSFTVASDRENSRVGTVDDGALTVTGGGMLPAGATVALAYQAEEAPARPLTLGQPTDGAVVAPGTPLFTGSGHPGATITVRGRFGTLLGTTTVDAEGAWSIASTVFLVPGTYAGTVTQTAGRATLTAPFAFRVVDSNPVTLATPAAGAVVAPGKPVFTGTGKPGATVTVRGRYGTLLGSTIVDDRGGWSVESRVELVPGMYAGTVTQDAAGEVTSAPFAFTAVRDTAVPPLEPRDGRSGPAAPSR